MKVEKIFFYRICGTGMGAAACLLKEQGHDVEGADSDYYPPMSHYLEQTKIKCHSLSIVDIDFLKQFDLIVVGNVVPKGSDDAKLIESSGVSYLSFPSAIGKYVLSKQNVVGLAGTHGKTTTTYLITQLFEKLGFEPGYLIGGVLEGQPSSRLGDGSYFFIESDEYDSAYFEKISKFRSYHLDHIIMTSLEFDHADIFADIEAIKDEFRAVMPRIQGVRIFSKDYVALNDLYEEFEGNHSNWLDYGEFSDHGPKVLNANKDGTFFELIINGKREEFKTNLVGFHNILNLSGAVLFASSEKIDLSLVKDAVKNLKLVRRRQEVRGSYKGAIVIDDFAHHPRAVRMTIDSIKQAYPDKKVVVILEPNSATARSSIFQVEFCGALNCADSVIFAQPSKDNTIKDVSNIDGGKIIDELNKKHKISGVSVTTLSELRDNIERVCNDSTVLLVLSNGTCLGLWESDFVDKLQT